MRADRASTYRTDGAGAVEAEVCTDSFDGTGAAGDGVSTDRTDGTCTDSFDGLTTPGTTPYKNTRSPEPTDRPGKPEGKEDETLPDDWQPNPTHLRSIEKIGGDPGEMVDEFRRRMRGENRTDWGATFGAYINQTAQGREDVTFPHSDPDEPPGPELPITWVRPDWLEAADERAARVMAGHPDDEELCRALGDYLESCARLGREPMSGEFPPALRRSVLG